MKLSHRSILTYLLVGGLANPLEAQVVPHAFFHQAPSVTLIAGQLGGPGNIDGLAAAARFTKPYGLAVDSAGNVYVSDNLYNTIRKISTSGVVTTLAGSPLQTGSADGTGSAARFYRPYGLAADTSGNVYVADTYNSTIRKITPAGVVTTLAGSAGVRASADGTGSAARFNRPGGVAVDGSGNIYVADGANSTIRMITPAGVVTTLAGTAGSTGSTDGTGAAARFKGPSAIAVDASGNLYVADSSNYTIRKITSGGVVTTLAGTAGTIGSADGTGGAASFGGTVTGISVDSSGNVYLADSYNSTLRKITPAGVVTTLAGTAGAQGYVNATGAAARFNYVYGLAIDISGNLYMGDFFNYSIRKITPTGVTTKFAGSPSSSASIDGTGAAASFNAPAGIAFDSVGNIYVTDSNYAVRKITAAGVVTTLAGTIGSPGNADGTGASARFNGASGIGVDSSGNVYVSEIFNCTVRKITPTGVVTTLAGSAGCSASPTDGTGSTATFGYPTGLAVDSAGNIYVTEQLQNTIRKVTPAGVVTTLAGTSGSSGSADGTGTSASFSQPYGIAVDASGNLFVGDVTNSTIRKITPSGVVTTLAGTAGSRGSTDGTGSAARFSSPYGITIDRSGNLYVSDNAGLIRKVTQSGVVTTVAGSAVLAGVSLQPLPASFNDLQAIANAPGKTCVLSENSVICYPQN